ncbi:Predicted arabinose efflux permease, MFS family [Enhydrobacter aerosaccus]|uniref:Predicted arabinose efflux permease, MFS family n=1 Tax=Enhydrobacter aerosaccus TaxID=225324 RepID=A0A1T4R327_9HYPH|nr:MFS transporter [Enhydrobacter aerosaccus]SKA10430.1 Predicted arabinose efflux permease, MFS family [Enhydrobacter aerosaccus]
MDSAGETASSRSATRELLASPDFLRLWLVGAFANAMRWLELLASGLFAYEATGSPLAVTAVVAARQLPQLFLGAFAGAVSEAVNRKLIVMLALIVPASVSTVLAILATTGHLALWHVALGNLLSGSMWATEMSTRRRMVGEVAGPHRIVPAIALDSTTSAATRMIGPLLGGLAFEWLHMKGAYTVTALVQFIGAFAMAGLVHTQTTRPLALGRIVRDIAEGLAFARTKSVLLLVFGITIVTNTFAFAYSSLVAPLGLGEFGVSPSLVGLLAAAEPAGALIGGLLIAMGIVRMNRQLTFAGGAALFMCALLVMALSPSYWLALTVMIVGGFGTAGFGNMQSTLMLTEAPPEMRSRLMGIVTVCIGTNPLGVLAIGVLSDRLGPRIAIVVMAMLGLVLTATLTSVLRRRQG